MHDAYFRLGIYLSTFEYKSQYLNAVKWLNRAIFYGKNTLILSHFMAIGSILWLM